ncbi:HDOD domain-containing protein [Clostridium sp. DJ247]|nr:HDOD domain-containing protein [Clostridium sp. DJ247]
MNGEEIIKYLDETNQLSVLNPGIVDIITMINSSDTLDVDTLADKISKCGNLSEALLININSGYFARSRNIGSLKDAIVLLGLETVERLILAYLAKALLPDNKGKAAKLSREKYWKHCLATSISASMLADKLEIEDKYRFFAYGLIHDVGIPILDIYLPDIIDQVVNLQHKGLHQIIAERQVMNGFTHSHIGAWISERWKLPNDIRAIVEYHHIPLQAKEYLTEVRILSVADSISTLYYERLLSLNTKYVINEKVFNLLGITMQDIEDISAELPSKVEEAKKLFNFTMFNIDNL